MSGGVAYVLDADGKFKARCNPEMVDLEALVDAEEIDFVQTLIMRHAAATGSEYAQNLMKDWASLQAKLVKVMPREYKRALAEQAKKAAAEAARVSESVVAQAAAAAASPAHG
jgi:glutamate synthase domain-containing protein 3